MTDKLKCCAEALGYEYGWRPEGIDKIGPVSYIWNNGEWVKYDPLHNDAQAFELFEVLMPIEPMIVKEDDGTYKIIGWGERIKDVRKNVTIISRGQTLNLAVINAVVRVKK